CELQNFVLPKKQSSASGTWTWSEQRFRDFPDRSRVLLAISLHQIVHARRHRDGVVPFALPHVAPENQTDAAGFHGNPRLMDRRVVAHLASARNEHERAAGGLDDLARSEE